jgi:hypothetical protein
MKKLPKIVLKYSRLTFVRDFIEPLALDDIFRIETPTNVFEMSKRDFYDIFPGVVKSQAYKDNGFYNYTVPPQKVVQFRVDGQQSAIVQRSPQGKYILPDGIQDTCTDAAYKKWLHRKAQAHVTRDKKRWKLPLSVAEYKKAIHTAVQKLIRHDAYTGEILDWSLISKYDNNKSKQGGVNYKKKFAMLPTVDHAGDVPGDMNFRICSWRTNDAKSDLTLEEFVELCRKVVEHNDRGTS